MFVVYWLLKLGQPVTEYLSAPDWQQLIIKAALLQLLEDRHANG